MTNSIVHISLESEKIIKPIKRDILKRIVSSYYMDHNPCKHHQIRKVRKSEFFES